MIVADFRIIMEMIKCPNCGNLISDKAFSCTECGHRIDDKQKVPNQEGLEWYMWVLFLITNCWIGSLLYYFVKKNKAPKKAQEALICTYISLALLILFYLVF